MGSKRRNPNKPRKRKTEKQRSPIVATEAPKLPDPLPSNPENEKQSDGNEKADTKSPKEYQGTREMHIGFLLGVSYQVVAVIFVALAFLALGYYMNNKDYKGIILSAFALYVAIGLLITLYALQHYRSSQKPLLPEQNSNSGEITPSPIPALPKPIENPLEGVLIPGNGPTPSHPCQAQFQSVIQNRNIKLSDDAVTIQYGNSAALLDKKLKFTLIRAGTDDLLSITKTPDGISVSAKVFSSDSRIIAQIIENRFHINPNNYFRIERPDPHTLTVYDQQANRVLHVEFINKHVIKAGGVFHHVSGSLIVIDESSIKFGNNVLSNYCSFDSNLGIVITPEGTGIK